MSDCLTYIGNDIMHFANNIKTFSRNGVVKKILSDNELKITSSNITHNNLIIAWTIKESVYKILCKEGYRKPFGPKKIIITKYFSCKHKIFSGEVDFQNKNYYFQSEVKEDFVYTFASNKKDVLPKIEHHFFKNNIENNSSLSNPELLRFLNQNIWKLTHTNNGIPKITNTNFQIDISISHDHNLMIFCEYKNL